MSRPRDPRIDDAVLPIALDAFFRGGVDGLSMVEVAQRAGVGRQSLYRRWPTKRELVLAAVYAAPTVLPVPPPEATFRDRLVHLIGSVDAAELGTRMAAMVGRLGSERERYPDVVAACVDRFVRPRRAQLRAELERGVRLGEMRADVDLDLLVEALTAPLVFPYLTAPVVADIAPMTAAALVDLVIHGAAPRPSTERP
jgi:AcrR family transcriptional regulator